VLGADVVVLERPGFVLGEDDYLACSFGESLEHLFSLEGRLSDRGKTEGIVAE
jgi:hypothetical protein